MRPERPCPMHSPSFMVRLSVGGRSCMPVSTGSWLGTSVRRRRTGMGRVGSSSIQTGLTRSGGSGERFSNTRGSGVVVVPSPEMASRRVSVSDARDAGAGADSGSDSDYMMMMMMMMIRVRVWITTRCCLLRCPYGVTVCGGAHARTLTRMPRQRQSVCVVHHGGSSRLNDGRASVQCVSSPHQSELRTTIAPVAPVTAKSLRVFKLPPLPASGSATARTQCFNADHHPVYFLSSPFSVHPHPPFRHSAIPPFNSPMVQ